ncbi:hypothetical protein KQI86_09975 [Clostridium sp. MSJ-11]|uniref:Transcriptional regulator HTH-type FeoC domain-containing protein n=1 Tax=Clostridium mobile TaxID=2841512 RepID=A0ABS6EJS8_9CLOT|nr:hypothetical protein [Clostridium mobile]MBU5484659.1 hypothetical protein [Clostridium mobile]
MLLALLCEIAKGENYSNRNLANKLNTSEEVVIQIKKELEDRKYIKIYDEKNCSPSKCSGCTACSTSKTNNIPKMWELTDKGKKAVSKYI